MQIKFVVAANVDVAAGLGVAAVDLLVTAAVDLLGAAAVDAANVVVDAASAVVAVQAVPPSSAAAGSPSLAWLLRVALTGFTCIGIIGADTLCLDDDTGVATVLNVACGHLCLSLSLFTPVASPCWVM